MGIFPIYFTRYKLTVDETYLISDGKRIREAKFVRSTERGFNFIDVATQKKLFKKHLYPREIVYEGMKEFTFMILKNITIDKKQTV
jgi:hypothetical protein